MTDQDEVPDSTDRIPPSPCRPSPRSLRSAAVAVVLTGVLIVVVPLGLLLGKNGLVTASVNRSAPIPTPHLTACDSGETLRKHQLIIGECVKVVGAGFAANELIQVSESRPAWQGYVRADGAGRFELRHVVSAKGGIGTDVLSFVGLNGSGLDAVPRAAFCRLTVSNS